jgi:hypothetical protein
METDGYTGAMSQTHSADEASSTAPEDIGYAGDWPGSTAPHKVESGPFVLAACKCAWPNCHNVSNGYCKVHSMWLEGI